jgi:hypothetical protein
MSSLFSSFALSLLVLGALCTLLLARLVMALRTPVRAANRLRFDAPPPAEKSAPPSPTFRLGRLTLDE